MEGLFDGVLLLGLRRDGTLLLEVEAEQGPWGRAGGGGGRAVGHPTRPHHVAGKQVVVPAAADSTLRINRRS